MTRLTLLRVFCAFLIDKRKVFIFILYRLQHNRSINSGTNPQIGKDMFCVQTVDSKLRHLKRQPSVFEIAAVKVYHQNAETNFCNECKWIKVQRFISKF